MNSHIHFIGIPERGDSLAKTFNSVHMRYSQFFNKKLGVGSGNFLKELEKELGKVLRIKPRGRPWHKERNK